MSHSTDCTQIIDEVEAVLRRHGINLRDERSPSGNGQDADRIRFIALDFLLGKIGLKDLRALSSREVEKVFVAMRHLLDLRNSPGMLYLQKANPYFAPFRSRPVRDNTPEDNPDKQES